MDLPQNAIQARKLMSNQTLPHGTEALMKALDLRNIMQLLERTARWVDPATFELLPVWYPEHSRKAPLFKANWSRPQTNRNRQTGRTTEKYEGNVHAAKALTSALGLRSNGRQGWSCCHLWGVDDPKFQETNHIVQDPKFFSCIANMVLLPTPLKAFTDTIPDVKQMLRACARNTYKWQCDHPAVGKSNAQLDTWVVNADYPGSWPKEPGEKLPVGTVLINDKIRRNAHKRWNRIREDMETAGAHYPRDSVMGTLEHWSLDISKDLNGARTSPLPSSGRYWHKISLVSIKVQLVCH